jgi:hypothetical protein
MIAFKFTSDISSRSLPVAQYSFAQFPTDEVLETQRYVDPANITNELLDYIPKTSMRYTYSTPPLRVDNLLRTILFILFRLGRIHSYWSSLTYKSVALAALQGIEPIIRKGKSAWYRTSKVGCQRIRWKHCVRQVPGSIS